MARAKSARRIGAAIAALLVTVACGQNATVANPPAPVATEDSAVDRKPPREQRRDKPAPADDPFAAPEQEGDTVVAAPEPSAPAPAPLPPPRRPKLKKEHARWSYPPISLVVSYVEGTLYVGAQGWARDGCHYLVGSARGNHIRIKGEYDSESGNNPCTMAIHADWYAVPVHEGVSSVTVSYAGHRGRYRIDVSRDGVETRYQSGDNVAPPESETWWWIPDDILFARVWYGNPAAIRRVSERVHERLMDEGATTFETPEGQPIPIGHSPDEAPGYRDEGMRDDYGGALSTDSRGVYLSGLSWKELRDIANDEAQTERCTYVSLSRRLYTDGVIGRPPCDRD